MTLNVFHAPLKIKNLFMVDAEGAVNLVLETFLHRPQLFSQARFGSRYGVQYISYRGFV